VSQLSVPHLRQHNDFNPTFLYVENPVCHIPLRENDLIFLISGDGFPGPHLLQENMGIEWIV
jgi:hypothetical protein